MKIFHHESDNGEKGVSIVEIGIVMVIMGFLVAGIISAQSLIAAAKVRAVISDIGMHQGNYSLFINKFRKLPGDMANFSTFYSSEDDGDGDGRIEYTGGSATDHEGNLAWRHMNVAGLADGSFTGASDDAIVDQTVPGSSAAGGAAGFAFDFDSSIGNIMILFLTDGSDTITTPVLLPEAMWNVDKKLDDGLPNLGLIRADGNSNCRNTGTSPVSYNLTSETLDCYAIIRMD